MKFLRFNSSSVQRPVYCLTSVIEALRSFQDYKPNIRAAAIALYSSELALQHGWQQLTAELHVYAIAHLAGLGGQG